MKLKKLIPLLLMACVLTGCMQAVADEDAFGPVSTGGRQPASSSQAAEPPASRRAAEAGRPPGLPLLTRSPLTGPIWRRTWCR